MSIFGYLLKSIQKMGEGIFKIIFDIYANQATIAQTYANLIEPKVRLIAGIGALIYIFGKLITQIANNQEIDFFPFLRPFAILLLIPLSPQICTAIDTFGEEVRSLVNNQNENIATRVQNQTEKIEKLVEKKWEEIGKNPEKYAAVFNSNLNEDKSGFLGEVMVDFKIGMYKFSEEFKFQILSVVQSILLCLMQIAECCLLLISISFRIVLRIGFPITVALSIFPGFTSSLAYWFGKYINFALLPAVAAMYSSIAFNLCDTYIGSYDIETSMATMGVETQQPEFLGLAFIGLLFLSLVGYWQVPSMTAMLVNVGGVGTIVQGATRTIQNSGTLTTSAFKKSTETTSKSIQSAK
jgi:hypothetical protein